MQNLPCIRVYVDTRDPIEENNLMEFRLLYEGLLPSCTNTKRRAKEKHEIRKMLHPQLRRLWNVRGNLRQLADRYFSETGRNESPVDAMMRVQKSYSGMTDQERFEVGIAAIGRKYNRAGFQLVPLVTEELVLQCSLDVLLLRPSGKRLVLEQGDIDGQVKTLFDALRIPSNMGETGEASPDADENPLFCLLEDDKLISEVKVTADELLMLPKQREVSAIDSLVVIHVKLNHRDPRTFDNYFG